jgi:L-threonylcarbamoyladenylate synthase
VATSQAIQKAVRILDRGGVIAYPTEGVFGLGCLPDNFTAVSRVLDIKQRDPDMGLVLIAAAVAQLDGWIDLPRKDHALASDSDQPVTWIVPAADDVPRWIRGDHAGIAVRITTHPVARALCEAAGSALVSTSANISGRSPARNAFVLRRHLGSLVDYIVPGECGPASGPSEIRVLESGEIVRPHERH